MKQKDRRACSDLFLSECGRRDLNPYGMLHTPLKRARLPVPPLPRSGTGTIIPRTRRDVKRVRQIFSGARLLSAVELPDAAPQNDHEDVEHPGDRDEEQDDRDDEGDDVLRVERGHDAVDAPHDVEAGEREDDLHEQGKIVEAVDECFHVCVSFVFLRSG